ncbi:UreF-domain-containing protein [Mycena floridula]|nr:UreF-domain-containing protein [Mycena floridula]
MSDDETYILLLLSDSNLPTGAFVASNGLESYIKHGFGVGTLTFLKDSLVSYARSAMAFVSDAHRVVSNFRNDIENEENTLSALRALDDLYHSMTLNHVTRRASKSQGVALLTLYSKGFSRPDASSEESTTQENMLASLITRYKTMVRREEVHGHLPTCWGMLTGALGLTLERAQYLHLFLHARSLLSAAVRLNEIGPYNSQQILLHLVQPLVSTEAKRSQDLQTGLVHGTQLQFDETVDGPANTWPLGEILAARHDLQHSRIFNS